jgi:4-amino-4-deoxy-L-arabinose transferase-like glycosyltransferase
MSGLATKAVPISGQHERQGLCFFPESSAQEKWLALLVFLVSGLYLYLFHDYTILNGDEGIMLQGTQRILQGQVLYRDFFSFYTPGSYYWLALLFRIFGSSMLVGRAALVVYGGLFSVLTYLLARRVCSRWSALLAVYLVTLTCLPYRFLVSHNWDSTLLAYLALYCAVLWIERGHRGWALSTGSFAALTFLFEQSKGAGLVLGLVAGFMVIVWRGQLRNVFRARQVAGLATGFAWPFIATLSYFTAKHGMRDMLEGWAWPLFHYSVANQLPYGHVVMSPNGPGFWSGPWGSRVIMSIVLGPLLLIPVLPIIAVGIFIWFTFRRSRRELLGQKWAYWVLISSVLCGLLFSTLLTRRPDFTHLNHLAPLFYLVLAWVLDGLDLQWRVWRSLVPVVAFYAFLSATAFGMAMLWAPLRAHHKVRTARGTVRTDDADRTLDYVQANVTPGETIFVYPYAPSYYYLTATFNPTRFDFLQLGMHTADQFQESLRELAADRTRAILLETSFKEKLSWSWPNTPPDLVAAKDAVEDYILANYRPCSGPMENGYWRFVFMVRKDLPCSKDSGLALQAR